MMPKKRYYDKMKASQEGGMITGKLGPALMPQDVIIKNYPSGSGYLQTDINDGMTGIDKQVSTSVSDTKRELSPDKY